MLYVAIPELFNLIAENLYLLITSPISLILYFQPLATTSLYSVSLSLVFWISHVSEVVYVFLCITYLTQHNALKAHLVVENGEFSSFLWLFYHSSVCVCETERDIFFSHSLMDTLGCQNSPLPDFQILSCLKVQSKDLVSISLYSFPRSHLVPYLYIKDSQNSSLTLSSPLNSGCIVKYVLSISN